MHDVQEAYKNLANAIIIQAANDYRHALRILALKPKIMDKRYTDAKTEKRETTKFFNSHWFGELTSIDGGVLIEKLNKDVK